MWLWRRNSFEWVRHRKKSILIKESEAILFLYNLHNEDFMIDRQRSINDILEFMYSTGGIQNEFWGDIGIIYKNQRKNVMYELSPAISL